MATVIIAQRMWQRNDTAANWTAKNPVLAAGEIGVELGATSSDPQKFKIGNGTTQWSALAYFGTGGGGGSVWYTGAGVPSGGLGADGDMYLRTSNGDVYQKSSGSWAVVANIVGPIGPAGPTGPAGPAGPTGSSSGQLSLGAGDRVNPLPTGVKALTPVTFGCTIEGYVLLLFTNDNATGSISVDVRKVSYLDYVSGRPDTSDSILSAPLNVVSNHKTSGNSSAFVDDVINPNDILVMVVISRSDNVTHVALAVNTEKT